MSLANLSNLSLSKTFRLLQRKDAIQLRKTAFKFEDNAKKIESLNKVDVFEIRLHLKGPIYSGPPQFALAICTSSLANGLAKYDGTTCLKRLESKWKFDYINEDNYSYVQKRRVANTTERELQDLVFSMLSTVLEKVNKYSFLVVDGFKIDRAFTLKLKEQNISPEEGVCIYFHKDATTQDVSYFTKTMKPKYLNIRGNLRKVELSDLHTSLTPLGLKFKSYNYPYPKCREITDQTLINWTYSLPNAVNLERLKTSFTLRGIVKFIQDVYHKLINSGRILPRTYHFGNVLCNSDIAKYFVPLQRLKDIDWEFSGSDRFDSLNRSGQIVPHRRCKITLRGTVTIEFKVYKSFNKCTNEQVRQKYEKIREIAATKLLAPGYHIPRDSELLEQISNLRCKSIGNERIRFRLYFLFTYGELID